MILVIDNYDSFVHNLARYFRQLGCETVVMRNDQVNVEIVKNLTPEAIVISPGPCTPDKAGCSLDLVAAFASSIPMLGICLGHQAMVQALGGKIVRANQPIHGRQSEVSHTGSRMFSEIPSPFVVGRYHSLVANVRDLPAELNVTARCDDGTIMAIEHNSWPMVGLQFHPESILTQCGYKLLINFLKLANLKTESDFSEFEPNRHPVADSLFSAPIVSKRLSKQESP